MALKVLTHHSKAPLFCQEDLIQESKMGFLWEYFTPLTFTLCNWAAPVYTHKLRDTKDAWQRVGVSSLISSDTTGT